MPPAHPRYAAERSDLRDRLDAATARLDPPFGVVDLDAFDANATALIGRAGGKPVRVASKSVRSRELLRRVLARPGWRGVMAYALTEAIWLAEGGVSDDILVGYPTVDRTAVAKVAASPELAAAITLMVDSVDQLDFVDAVTAPDQREPLRVCIDLDASWKLLGGRLHIGVRRSPLHRPEQTGALAAAIAARPGFRLVGLMAYEAQIAGMGDAPPGHPVRGAALRRIQARSLRELIGRRTAAVAAVRRYADLEFVNGGGTGSLATTTTDPSVTELTSGSGLYGPVLFDAYRAWQPTPAAFFATSVVRRPTPDIATVHGGGWIASGAAGADRLPEPWLPAGLHLLGTEGAGEVQTPLAGSAAAGLRIGDRVWFRHAKAGEVCEHLDALQLVRGDTIEDVALTYRGERAPAFL
ncbi:amino acid deaminase/aldolase [Luedemannella flava]|uniref:Amino acid deaminase/aldolase n=1 Tax=Luedemannella flava TaxID=349316 RepID=A0ABN2M734_9ACTN